MAKITQIKNKESLELEQLEAGQIHRFQLHIPGNSLGTAWRLPIIVAKGVKDGPVLGITAAVHGDELNGLSSIFKLFAELNPEEMSGTLVAVPIYNVPGYMSKQRYFIDRNDLNRFMPGKRKGNPAEIYNYHLTHKIIKKFNYLMDLHTASAGKVNSLYIRADLENAECKTLAYLQNPQIIVQKYDAEGTLRGWANTQNIPSITVEIGNPNTFQHDLIDDTLDGIKNTMRHLKMIEGPVRDFTGDATICDHSYWINSYSGGIIDVLPKLTQKIKKGELIAKVYDVFGDLKDEIFSDQDGVVIGKNTSPSCEAGMRIVHLGVNNES